MSSENGQSSAPSASRCSLDRASLWWHVCDFARDICGEVSRTFPEVVKFVILLGLCAVAPVSFPIVAWIRRSNEQRIDDCESRRR